MTGNSSTSLESQIAFRMREKLGNFPPEMCVLSQLFTQLQRSYSQSTSPCSLPQGSAGGRPERTSPESTKAEPPHLKEYYIQTQCFQNCPPYLTFNLRWDLKQCLMAFMISVWIQSIYNCGNGLFFYLLDWSYDNQ